MFKTYEDQAKLSVGLAVLGGVCVLGVIGMLARNFDATSFFVNYNPKGMWLPIIGGGLVLALLAGTVGFFVGLNSAGQRRNQQSALSWKGFFLNALVLTVVLGAAVFFYFTRNAIEIR